MENRDVLKPRRWSVVGKAQVIGALVGAGITIIANIAIPLLLEAAGRGSWGPLLVYSWGLSLWPASAFCHMLLGWKWQIDPSSGPSLPQLLLAVFVNALLLYFVVAGVGWITDRLKRTSKNRPNS